MKTLHYFNCENGSSLIHIIYVNFINGNWLKNHNFPFQIHKWILFFNNVMNHTLPDLNLIDKLKRSEHISRNGNKMAFFTKIILIKLEIIIIIKL